ncbi:MAG TPA: dihydroorotase [Rhodanobacteraceae bacterium]|nr:dihydroorotase [Rhodanobacteraceae bacterium]
MNWLIRDAELINEGQRRVADLRIRGGRIEAIGSGLAARADERVLDAGGQWLLPGVIDAQVHFREPGLEHKGDLASESAAAVAGGVTSFLEMPNTRPPTLDAAALEDKYRRAQGRARANFGFYFGASNDNLEAIRRIDPASTPGLKVFMGASTGNMLVDDPQVLDAIFRDCPVPIITHCEDTPSIEANHAAARARHGEAIPAEIHGEIRSREACLKSTQLALELARRHGTSLHVLHISTADELALFAPGPVEGKQITAETCVHFLHFAREDYRVLGHLIKCNPAIKEASDRDALLHAIIEDRIDVLATDHAPHTYEEKKQVYDKAPSGLPLVQDFVISALELVHEGKLDLTQFVRKACHAPALRFGIVERGFLREGFHADLTLVDPHGGTEVTGGRILAKCGWSPFLGRRFRARIAATFVNGRLAFDGQRLADGIHGQRLAFAR